MTAPSLLGTTSSFGFGDRLGLATPGHLAALKSAGSGIAGIFSQQSIREMDRTQRQPTDVMSAAVEALKEDGYDLAWGADADHLKTTADVDVTVAAGFVFFTIDPSDYVDQDADSYCQAVIEQRYKPTAWVEDYLGRTITLPNGMALAFDESILKRAAVKYGWAIDNALQLAGYIKQAATQRGQPYEIEVSVDETVQPTTLAEHYIIAEQLIRGNADHAGLGDSLVSLAPRFVGEFEKGVDYIGDLEAFERSLEQHHAIASHLGPYKLSLHSGSDKLSIYQRFARVTEGRFHVKTAGTSYLEALRVVAEHDPALFRLVVSFARDCYTRDKASYHVHATLADVPPPEAISDDHELVGQYLEHWADIAVGRGFTAPGRQVLHCTFGSVMTDAELAPAVTEVLSEHAKTYQHVLTDHFVRHLNELKRG